MTYNPNTLASRHGLAVITTGTIAYTVVADGGTEIYGGASRTLIKITAAAHGLKKNQDFYIGAGAYIGIHTVRKIIDANNFLCDGTFGVTAAGNLVTSACLNGFGFYVISAPTIVAADFEPEDSSINAALFIAQTFVVGQYYPCPFKKIRISAGSLQIVRSPIKATLSYTNR